MNAVVPIVAGRAEAASLPARSAQAGFLPHVHSLRAVAILLVVGAHCWPDFAWTAPQERHVLLAFDNVTVMFMFISGLLFQHLSGRFRYAAYLKHRFSIVILPYLIVSIPAVVMAVFVQHRHDVWPGLYRLPVWEQIGYYLLTGRHLAPLWFMPMMALFILASPALIRIDRWRLYRVLLPVTMVLATILGRDSMQGLANVFGKALFMLPAYLAGMAFGRHRIAAEEWVARLWPLLLAALVVVSAAIYRESLPALDLTLVQKLLFAALALTVLRRVPAHHGVTRFLAPLADLSFGIYFVHGYVITAFRILYERVVFGPEAGDVPPFGPSVTGLVIHVVAVTAVSVCLIRIAQKLLGGRSRMIVGA